jgi:hypothetical protein
MAYALDLLIALLCALTAIPLLMQLRPSTTYRRSLNSEGEPIGGAAGAESAEDRGCGAVASYEGDGVTEQIANIRGKDAPPPEGEGWRREPSGKGFRHYLSFALGAVMMVGAVWLVVSPPWPSHYVAWAIFAGAALYGARGLPQLFRSLGQGALHPANYIMVGIAALGAAEGSRLI